MKWTTLKQGMTAALLVGAMSMQSVFAAPTLSGAVTAPGATAGATFGLDIFINDIADLSGYNFSLNFNGATMQVLGGSEGGFLGTAGETYFDLGDFSVPGVVFYTMGFMMSDLTSVSGSGLLAHYDFSGLASGATGITFSDVVFFDTDSKDIPVALGAITPLAAGDVPEPATLALLGLALVGLTAMRRRRGI